MTPTTSDAVSDAELAKLLDECGPKTGDCYCGLGGEWGHLSGCPEGERVPVDWEVVRKIATELQSRRAAGTAGERVKALEWYVVDETWERAQTLFGLTYDATNRGWYSTVARFVPCPDLQQSKSAAEADYRARILSALTPTEVDDAGVEGLIFPETLTEELREVLSFMLWDSGQLAHVLRAGGAQIQTKAEAEQAYVLHWLVTLALRHGADWRARASDRVQEIRAILAATKPDSGGK